MTRTTLRRSSLLLITLVAVVCGGTGCQASLRGQQSDALGFVGVAVMDDSLDPVIDAAPADLAVASR